MCGAHLQHKSARFSFSSESLLSDLVVSDQQFLLLQHPHLPGANPDSTTDKSDAKTPTYDTQPDMMTDETLANKPKQPGKRKDGEALDSDNSLTNKDGPRKEPEDIAPEQAGS